MYTEIQIWPRFSETDANGHINNTVPAVWFEEGRSRLIYESAKVSPAAIIAHIDIDYLAEMRFRLPVTIRTGIERFGEKSYTYYQEAWQDGRLCARARAVCAGWDHKRKSTIRISDEIRQGLAAYLFDEALRGRTR